MSHRAERDIGAFAAVSIRKRGSEISVGISSVVHGNRKIGAEVEIEICTAYKHETARLLIDYKVWSYWRMWSESWSPL